jgi:GT2 family glycosyltransferase
MARVNAIGVVVIGRNEAARLAAALQSVTTTSSERAGRAAPVVYVDSGSRDASVAIARSAGLDVVELDRARPFTAARARNEGFRRLRELAPDVELVQFLDGDCELDAGWLDAAAPLFASEASLAAVCGALRERGEATSLWNRLVALDWRMVESGIGGYSGVLLVRASAFQSIGGFEPSLVAGEDPDLALRLAQAGHTTRRIDAAMALHDAQLVTLRQWWRRALRTGHSNAELAWRHRGAGGRARLRAVASALGFGLLLPLAAAALSFALAPSWRAALPIAAALALFQFLWLRIAWRARRRLRDFDDAALYASGCLLAKFAAALGVLRFTFGLLRLLPRSGLIESDPS